MSRASGILLHPTSLPGRFGIGDLGPEAYRFADFLAGTGQHLWQMLPLGPTDCDNSPYQCLSVFAGNPLLISPERLVQENLLDPVELERIPAFPVQSVDYDAVADWKMPLLRRSFEIFRRRATPVMRDEFQEFCQKNSSWLEDYALFMSLREAHRLAAWNTWEDDTRKHHTEALGLWRSKLAHIVDCHKYQQFQFFKQWAELKRFCNERGIKLIGDIPIFVALDSTEVWAQPEMFHLDNSGQPTVVAGVPPDYFSETGQLWGNPLYRWDEMVKDGYRWWIQRFRVANALVDLIRLDHFRGFEKYWEIPAGEKTAINGRWVPGPGAEFFQAVEKALGKLPIIAEDLGMITPEVEALRDQFALPGMRVLQFSFGPDSKTRPYNYPRNCLVYTGTHDNNTTAGWFRGENITTLSREQWEQERQRALDYLGTDGREINWDFIRLAFMSVADTAIVPLQDVLGLGSEARINIPGVTKGNWRWRFTADMLNDEIASRLKKLTATYGRSE